MGVIWGHAHRDYFREVFHLVGFGIDGKIAFRRRIRGLAA